MDRIKYYRRRQFVLGPRVVNPGGWEEHDLEGLGFLVVHPDLAVTTVRIPAGLLVLLGDVLDSRSPASGNRGILEEAAARVTNADQLPAVLEPLSGRFVLLAALNGTRRLYHDAVGLRQVTYCRDGDGAVWCASQAETLAEVLRYGHDPEVLSYRNLPMYQRDRGEFWLLHDRTPYRAVRHLLPNHCLDLDTGRASRYWPVPGAIPQLSIADSIEQCTPILEGSIAAAASRFDLCLGMSAGMDSRKTLAAAREVRDRIRYFSHAPGHDRLDVHDIRVPARLLPRLGLRHESLGWNPMSSDFREIYEASATWAREKKGHIAHTLFRHFGPDTVIMNSNISEVAQCVYWLPARHLDGEGLAILSGLNHPFAVRSFQAWVDGAAPACEAAGMELLDLFFLEQRMGRWTVAAFSEYDVAHDTFNPYNNRLLHRMMLAIHPRHRRDRRWDVPIRQIRAMWPDVLCEPVNPQDSLHEQLQQTLRRFVVHRTITPWLPVYQYLRFLKKRRRYIAQGAENAAGASQ